MSFRSSSTKFDGDVVVKDEACASNVEVIKEWINCGPTWLKMLKMSGEAGDARVPKSAAVMWFLCSFAGVDGSTEGQLMDVNFLRWDIVGHLSLVHFRFEKETGLARLRFVEGVDGDWSTGCTIPMCKAVACALDWMFEEHSLMETGRVRSRAEARRVVAKTRFERWGSSSMSKESEGSVGGSEDMDVVATKPSPKPSVKPAPVSPLKFSRSAVMDVHSVSSGIAGRIVSVERGTASTHRSHRACSAMTRFKPDKFEDTSIDSSSESEWNGVDDQADNIWK